MDEVRHELAERVETLQNQIKYYQKKRRDHLEQVHILDEDILQNETLIAQYRSLLHGFEPPRNG